MIEETPQSEIKQNAPLLNIPVFFSFDVSQMIADEPYLARAAFPGKSFYNLSI
jgi:hypothetical protein